MPQNLKRKRENQLASRKTRKVQGEPDEETALDVDDFGGNTGAEDGLSDYGDMVEDDVEAEWGGVTGGQADVGEEHRPGTKPKKPPTGEELRAIKDAADLFGSGSFKLQIDALLPNVRPKASRIPPLERFLLSLHTFLMGIPSVSPQHPLEAARKLLKKGVAVPYSLPLPTEDTNWKVAFDSPSDITLAGSWANKVSVKLKDGLKFGVDLAVEMPNSLFQEKDYLNGRFFHKRSFYLATIAAAIQSPKSGFNVEVYYESLLEDVRLTKLVLISKSDGSHTDYTKLNAQVNIIPVLSPSSPIPLHRLSPSHSNIRISANEDAKPPTPLYNNALLRSFTSKSHLLTTYSLKEESPAFADALTLLRIWANQRGFSEGSRFCVRGFEGSGPFWVGLLALLMKGEEPRASDSKYTKRRPLGKGLSSYQLFKAALDCLAKHPFGKSPLFVNAKDGHRFPPEEYEGHEAVLVDSGSFVNLLSGVPLGSVKLLQHEASKTLEILNETMITGDPFTQVSLKDNRDLSTRFDVVLRIDLSSVKPHSPSIQTALDSGSTSTALMSSLGSLVSRGLGDRVQAAAILHPSPAARPISQAHPFVPDVIVIGLVVDPQNAFRLVDHGPAADDEDQVALNNFRELWGDKSELRRFKDGRIIESVVWEVKTADERAHVPAMIVQHILKRHFGLEEDAVQTWQSSFDSVLRLPESISSKYLTSGVSTGFKGALTAFDNLVKAIKALDDELPLTLSTVSPTSELLRYTSVFSPVPLPASLATSIPPNARYLAPIDIVLEFEKSSKWPDDLRAIQKIKLAFFERLASVLMESVSGLKANVVVGAGIQESEIVDKAFLEIVTSEGWAFSARIWHDREATLLDRIIDDKQKVMPHIATTKEAKKGKGYSEGLLAKELYIRRFIHAPRHHRAIAALCHRYTAFSGTVRLVKRWLASHWLLQGHITEEAVEIICAHFFVGDGRKLAIDVDAEQAVSHLVPASKERGFATVVQFLAEWKWEDGLFVHLYGPKSPESSKPTAKGSTEGVWSISTEVDSDGRMWTSHGPDMVVAFRVRALAKATWDYLQGLEHGQLNVQSMFIHPTDDYDFIIHLDPMALARYHHNVAADHSFLSKQGKYANQQQWEVDADVLPGFDPARLLFSDLQRIYADTFKIFFDPYGGDRFGGVWDPALKQPRPFRVLGGFSSIPVAKESDKAKEKGLVTLNEKAILGEIERMGMGLIKHITAQSKS